MHICAIADSNRWNDGARNFRMKPYSYFPIVFVVNFVGLAKRI